MLSNYVAGEDSSESPLVCKEIKPVNPKGNKPWIFSGRTDAEVEAPILWPRDPKGTLNGKDQILGKIEGKRRWVWQKVRWSDSTTNSMDINVSKLWEIVKNIGDCLAAVHGFAKSWTWFSDWTSNTDIRSENFKITFDFFLNFYKSCFFWGETQTPNKNTKLKNF